MQRINRPQDKWRDAVFFLTGLLIVAADQFSKNWIRTNLDPGQSIFRIGFFQITYANNTGAAFGLFQNHTLVLTIISIIGVIAILVGYRFVNRIAVLQSMPWRVVLGLVLGGTLGNLIDRARLGYVTDFIDFHYWPAFNVADASVTIGILIFAYFLLRFTASSKS